VRAVLRSTGPGRAARLVTRGRRALAPGLAAVAAATLALVGRAGTAAADVSVSPPTVMLSLATTSGSLRTETGTGDFTGTPPILVAEGATGDFSSGTLVLRAPAGFEFGVAVAIPLSLELQSTDAAVTSPTEVTITIVTSGSAVFDTILLIATVRPTTTSPGTGSIHRPAVGGGTAVIPGIVATASPTGAGRTSFADLKSVAGTPQKVDVVTLDNNLTNGSGAPTTSLVAGRDFSVRVTARDRFGNGAAESTYGTVISGFPLPPAECGATLTFSSTMTPNAPDGTAPTIASRSGSATFQSGAAEVSGFALVKAGAGQSIRGTVEGTNVIPVGVFADSPGATVAAGPPDRMQVICPRYSCHLQRESFRAEHGFAWLHLWCWWSVAQREVRPDPVVRVAPHLDQDLRLEQGVEALSVQALVAQPAVERLDVAVLPGAARLGEQRLHVDPPQPAAPRPRRELRAVVRADVGRRSAPHAEVGEHVEHILRTQPPRDLDRQALARVLVDHGEHP